MTVVLGFFGVLGLLAFSALWRGYVLTVLWAWFAVPTFGLPALHLAPAIGLSLLVSFLTHQVDMHQQEGEFSDRMLTAASASITVPLFALGIGWVVRQFM
jgi:hypothetical protein